MRFLGTFLADLSEVPQSVVAYLAQHEACLVLLDTGCADRHTAETVFPASPEINSPRPSPWSPPWLSRPTPTTSRICEPATARCVRFLPTLLETVALAATDAGRPAIEAFGFLKTIEGQKRPNMSQAPQTLLTPPWQRVVVGNADQLRRDYRAGRPALLGTAGLHPHETITKANARLVDYQAQIPLARAWGGGRGGLGRRPALPRPGPHDPRWPEPAVLRPRPWGHLLQLHERPVHRLTRDVSPAPCALVMILEGLLEQRPERPQDHHRPSPTDQVFGLFRLLGYQFSPRLADFGEARFWRIGPQGPLQGADRPGPPTDQHPADRAELGRPEDIERLSPLLLDHVNVLGRYEFNLKK